MGEAAVELLRVAAMLNPDAPDHTVNLGMVLWTAGKVDEAIEVFRNLLAARPDVVEGWNNLGMALKSKGRLEDAEEALRRAVQGRAGFVEAMTNLGVVLQEQGKLDEAIEWFDRAAEGGAGARYFNNLGNALLQKERFVEAEQAFRKALEREGQNGDALFGLGSALHRQGKVAQAVERYRAALAVRPDWPEVHYNLGRAFQDLKDATRAEAEYRKTLELRTDAVDAAVNLASVLRETNRPVEAEQLLRPAARAAQRHAGVWNALGGALADQERLTEALDAFAKALAIDPENHEAKWNRGAALLTLGRLAEGWEGYEARRHVTKVSQLGELNRPQWRGEDLAGKTILLHAEQGFGDTIQFVRYVPLVRKRGARVIVLCPRALNRLLSGQLGIEQVVSGGDEIPPFDVHCPLPSLPGVFKTTVATIPGREPYLRADEGIREKWRRRLTGEPGKLKVGLVWSGNPEHSNDAYRSIALSKLAPLAERMDVSFVSLQKGPAADQAHSPPTGMRLIDWTQELTDFAETAGLVANLDLVISVDTAAVHLAGAIGRPVWVMLPKRADWRWMREREDSPWYPTARLFRQKKLGEWELVVERIRDELKTLSRR
jgi:tetratricopeptide (TPR) repeat protein